jgi:glycosyltransferase involved in cell wall biosynthesis
VWGQLFDSEYYYRKRPDVAAARISAPLHYALAGAWEEADSSAEFHTGYYWKRHRDVARADLNPLIHYALFGEAEGRSILPVGGRPATVCFSPAVRSEGGPPVAPLVTVVIPCFNYGRYAEEAVHSVLTQTLRNTEIILVEGGSTDAETPARLRKLEGAGLAGLRVVYREGTHLAGDNRNFGISLARGRYVCCLDADDLLDPAYLEVAAFLLEFCGLDFVSPSVQNFGQNRERWIVGQPAWPAILQANQVSTVAVFRKQVWETIGGYRDWGKGKDYVPEDWDFWIRAVAAGFRGLSLELPMMMYRVRPRSLSRNGTASMAVWAERLAAEHAGLAGRPAPAEPPCRPAPRAAWESFEEDPPPAGAVMMALPFFTEGGAEKIFQALARKWRERGAKLVVITTLELNPLIPDRLDVLRRETRHVYPLAQLFRGREDRAADFIYFLLRRHKVRLLYFAGSDLIYRLLPQIRSAFPHLRVVDQLFNDEVHFHSNRALSRFIDCTIVPGSRIARRLTDEYGEEASRVAIIPHGVPVPDVAQVRTGLPPHGFPSGFSGKPVVGFFGRFSEEKGPTDFVRIAAKIHERFPAARFVMTGEGPEMKAVQREIRRCGLLSRFCLPGFVEDVQPWVASADVVVVPSRLDGMPLIVFEAQGLARPVVASRTGSIPEVIEDGVTGFLRDPGDIEGFAEAVCRLLESAELRSRIGAAARGKVLREYGQDVMVERYFQLFDRLARPRTGGIE